MMRDFLRDLGQALRSFQKTPGFTATALVTLALGIGANTALFSATYHLLLRPLPYPEPDRLVALYGVRTDQGPQRVSLEDLVDWQAASHAFAGMAAYRPRSFSLRDGRPGSDSRIDVIQVGMVTSDLLPVLGLRPRLGRPFSREEETAGAAVVLLGDRLWRRRFGGAPDLVGRRVLLNDVPRTVLGILPAGLALPMQGQLPDAYIPLSHEDYGGDREKRSLEAVARLRPGVSIAAARSELVGIAAHLAHAYPATNERWSAGLVDLHTAQTGQDRRPLLLLDSGGLLLLLLACTNVSSLLVARFLAHLREVAIHAALGAGARQLARRFLAEGLVLASLGAGLGLSIAGACLKLLPLALPLAGGARLPGGGGRPGLDGTALAIALALCVLSTLVFALVPTFLAYRTDLHRILQGESPSGGSRHRLRGATVVLQVAFCTMLLLASGLLLRSFFALLATDPGFRSERVLRFGIGLPEKRYVTDARIFAFHHALLDRLAALPGVEAAGLVGRLPLTGEGFRTPFEIDGAPPVPRDRRPSTALTALDIASPGYFRALRIPLLAGRSFTLQDGPAAPRVLLVNEAFRKAHFPGGSALGALGQRLQLGWTSDTNPRGTRWEVVGVVGDVRERSVEVSARPEVYLSTEQYPLDGGSYVLLTRRTDAALGDALRASVRTLDGDLEKLDIRPFADAVRASLADRRLALLLSGLFAAVALLLTAVGIYGVAAWTVARRRREMALRLALGADMGHVVRLVLGQGLRWAGLGLLLGLAGFGSLSRLLASHLYGVGTADPLTTVGVAVLVAATTLLACAVPSLRAARAPLSLGG
jgi:putative ABC transport system permease protein